MTYGSGKGVSVGTGEGRDKEQYRDKENRARNNSMKVNRTTTQVELDQYCNFSVLSQPMSLNSLARISKSVDVLRPK